MATDEEINAQLIELHGGKAMRLLPGAKTPTNAIAAKQVLEQHVKSYGAGRMESSGNKVPDCWRVVDTIEDVKYWIRPPRRELDAGGRTHCETGPALISDVGSWFYWHGVEVTRQVIEFPDTIKVKDIEAVKSEEVRRVMIERWPGGWERYLRCCGKMLDSRRNERDQQEERLYEWKTAKRLLVSDPSTGRRYVLGVPRQIITCEEAQQWLSQGLDCRATHRS